MVDLLPLQLGIPGGPELLVILLIAVLLFGANKIPKLARSTGEAMGEFQKGREEVEQELEEMREGEVPGEDGEPVAEAETEATPTAEANPETTTAQGGDEEFDIAEAEPDDETN